MNLSTLRSYVGALGGELRLTAVFADCDVVLELPCDGEPPSSR